MATSSPARARGLQRIATAAGVVAAIDLRPLGQGVPHGEVMGSFVLGCLSPWASAVVLPASELADRWLESEAVPRSIGVIRVGDSGDLAGADAILEALDSRMGSSWMGPRLVELDAHDADQAPSMLGRADLVVVSDPSPSARDWEQVEAALDVPWILAIRDGAFPDAVARCRSAVAAGASGIMIGPALWADITGDETIGIASPEAIDELRGRVVTLLSAIRSGMDTWDLEGEPTSDAATWFGARSFVHHKDIDQFEERVVLIRAQDDDAALAAAAAEVAEYAHRHGADALDLVQISPIQLDPMVSPGELSEWQEIYTQFSRAASTEQFLHRFIGSSRK